MTSTCFAIVAPGLETVVAEELHALGINARAESGGGGLSWEGSTASIAMANLWLRAASRVVVRAAEFRARTFFELERHARKITWDRWVAPGAPVRFRVTCKKSKLYHSDAVAQRFVEAAARAVGAVITADDVPDEDSGEDAPAQLFIVRFSHDVCTVSADSSGVLLHRRGYRQATAKAPIRETLAAGMLMASGWKGDRPLLDPLCGAGTIPIEAALIARRIAPGINRGFAFTRWPEHDESRWAELRARATERSLWKSPVPIAGSDRDAGAIEAARGNAERAGVATDVAFDVKSLSEVEPNGSDGLLIANPPYGLRVGDDGDVRNLYARLGSLFRERFGGWRMAVLSPDKRLDAQLQTAAAEVVRFSNGGIPVRLLGSE